VAIPVARSAVPEFEPAAQSLPSRPIPVPELPKQEEIPDEAEIQDPRRNAAVIAQPIAEEMRDGPAASGGKRALIQYDYEKAEDNEVELREGEYVTNIEMVDDDWWMGTNSRGESGLFPSNYVELVDDDDDAGAQPATSQVSAQQSAAAVPASAQPAAAPSGGRTATAQFDYEAAEDNELSFPEGATITDLEFPDEDWWFGQYKGATGLFPANYVQLD